MVQGEESRRPATPIMRARSNGAAAARVDDCLVQHHEMRDRLSTLLDAIPPNRKPARRLLHALTQEARIAGPHSARALVDLYIKESSPRRTDAARMVLEALNHDHVQQALTQANASIALTSDEREKLAQLEDLLRHSHPAEAPQRFVPPMQLQYTEAELVEAFLEALEESQAVEPEAIGLVWLRGFRGLPDDYRARLLRALADRRDPIFMPIFELEAQNQSIDVRRAVAASIAQLRVQESLELAQRLQFDTDVMVRYDAERAAETLQRVRKIARAHSAPVFDRCFCLAVPGAGAAGILYAVRATDGSIKFCSLLLDTWHRGVVDAWGNVGCDEAQFAEVVLAFSTEVAHASGESAMFGRATRRPRFSAITRAEALELIRNSVNVSRARGRRLPPEFPLWERLFRNESPVADTQSPQTNIVDDFVFDLHCAACTRRIAVNRTRTNLSVAGGYAFCSKCLSKSRSCKSCKQPFRLGSVSAKRIFTAFDESTCTRCLRKAARS